MSEANESLPETNAATAEANVDSNSESDTDEVRQPSATQNEDYVLLPATEQETKQREDPIEHTYKTTVVLDLSSYVIANYFKSLIKWGLDAAESNEEASNETKTLLLWGEQLEKADEADEGYSSVTLSTDNKNKKYCLLVDGISPTVITARVKRIERLIKIANRLKHTISLTDWCFHHREAISESDALLSMQKETKSSVLFHNSKERVVYADVVALTGQQQQSMVKYLEKQIPRQGEWSVLYDRISAYDDSDWAAIKHKFAVKLDMRAVGGSPRGKNANSLKAWGFSDLDKAVENIFSSNAIMSGSAKGITSKDTETGRGLQGGNSRQNKREAEDEETCGTLSKERREFHGHYFFQDREAGLFYLTFETQFQSYLFQKFNVCMTDSKHTVADISTAGESNSSGRVGSSTSGNQVTCISTL
jgi:hypothetical protein